MTRTALISGAGVGGLTAALALARRGWSVRVLERAEAFGEVGAGIQQSPNAMRVHQALGTAGALRAVSFAPEAATIRDGRTGRALVRVPLGAPAEARYGAPYLHCHRADLHGVLAAACEAAGVTVETGAVVTGYEPGALLTADGARGADLIVGADGARSVIRAQMGAPAPHYTGDAAWRALVPREALPHGFLGGTLPTETVSWTGPGRHVVTYAVREGTLVNLVAVTERGWTEEGWSVAGQPEELRAAFASFAAPVRTLLEAAEAVSLWGLFARPPLPRWSDAAVTLLGDAAHPMLPYLAQGASMALEDAWVLAERVARLGVPAGLRAYEAARRPRTARLVRQSQENRAMFHGGPGLSSALGTAKMRAARLVPQAALARLDGIYGADVTASAI